MLQNKIELEEKIRELFKSKARLHATNVNLIKTAPSNQFGMVLLLFSEKPLMIRFSVICVSAVSNIFLQRILFQQNLFAILLYKIKIVSLL